ncbi:MAG: AAA family ATPase [Methyloprofundus sp.]|nr:AAA family ATPase [Methyloprofundus sp.]
MQFDISIKNIGKISQADLKIRPFTVIAGKNSSGKSFVTKSLYSLFNAINKDHISNSAYKNLDTLNFFSEYFPKANSRSSKDERVLIYALSQKIEILNLEINKSFGTNTFSDQLLITHQLKEHITNVDALYKKLFKVISKKEKFGALAGYFDLFQKALNELAKLTESPLDCISSGITEHITQDLKENFQVSSLTELKNFHFPNEKSIDFDLGTLGKVKITNENLNLTLDKKSIDETQKLHNVIYLESPVYWKMSEALKEIQTNKSRKGRKETILTGVPKHFYDLRELITTKTTAQSIELYQDLNSAIQGEITISTSGALNFTEKGSETEISLHNTALGVTNLGIISLLLKKGILSKGSFLFIDEPEVHLHPSWQKIMVETLFTLSKNGVNVVIASHSIDMMKCVENIMANLSGNIVNDHFGINQLDSNGASVNEPTPPIRKIAAIKADLGESFNNMVMEGSFDWSTEE